MLGQGTVRQGIDIVRAQILITEGITDAISARQAGIPCISPVTTRFRKQDIPKLLKPALRHRISLNFEGEAEGLDTDAVLDAVIEEVRRRAPARPRRRG